MTKDSLFVFVAGAAVYGRHTPLENHALAIASPRGISKRDRMNTTGKLRFWLGILLIVTTVSLASCARVQVSEAYKGTVLDAESGTPLANVGILVRVMRVTSYDGTSQFTKYTYTTNERGEFAIPARKKIVDSVTEHMEEMKYYEIIAFGKCGSVPQEFRTDDERGMFSWSNTQGQSIVVRLKKDETKPTR